jgi:DNA topoisomerase-1
VKRLSVKTFHTYNASITFQIQLDEGTAENSTMPEKLDRYNHANHIYVTICGQRRRRTIS